MTEDQIKHMVNRFLNYRLPENWKPDGGVSFEKFGNKGTPHQYTREPSGTNLLDGQQAEAMVRYMLDGMPQVTAHAQGSGNCGDIARRAVENAETAAQLEIKDPELRDSLIRNFVQELERFRGALEPFAKVAESDIGQDETDADTFQPMRSGYNREPLITVGDMRRASVVSSTHSRCAKCHCETKGEAALVDGKIWCHPCADSVPSTSLCTCAAIVNPNIPHARTCPLSSTDGASR